MKPVVYLTVVEVKCPCGWFLNVRIKEPKLRRSCWKCNRELEVRLSGSSVTAYTGKEKLYCRIIAQTRQESK